jgi:uncharacterized protein
MRISMYAMAADSFVPALQSLALLLDKGAAHAKGKNLDLVNARLASDMYTLAQQVQQACYYAKDGTGRLTGRESAPMEDAGKTFAELQADIARTIDHVRGIPAAAFDNAEERDCSIEPPNANIVIAMDGLSWLRAWALPHFYFHVATAYGILRHNGVVIGKQDYMSWIGAFIRPRK